ncbi:hypothetical protein BU15DRAFT_67655 [Melanogaster broomeanus]|nr:hypothetical protein BU15DRAFT_67655 [Melanogaster broomeanus]
MIKGKHKSNEDTSHSIDPLTGRSHEEFILIQELPPEVGYTFPSFVPYNDPSQTYLVSRRRRFIVVISMFDSQGVNIVPDRSEILDESDGPSSLHPVIPAHLISSYSELSGALGVDSSSLPTRGPTMLGPGLPKGPVYSVNQYSEYDGRIMTNIPLSASPVAYATPLEPEVAISSSPCSTLLALLWKMICSGVITIRDRRCCPSLLSPLLLVFRFEGFSDLHQGTVDGYHSAIRSMAYLSHNAPNGQAATPAHSPDTNVYVCEWRENDGPICGKMFTTETLPVHLADHWHQRYASHEPTVCWWCRAVKTIKRESILRHVREVHLRLKRLPTRGFSRALQDRAVGEDLLVEQSWDSMRDDSRPISDPAPSRPLCNGIFGSTQKLITGSWTGSFRGSQFTRGNVSRYVDIHYERLRFAPSRSRVKTAGKLTPTLSIHKDLIISYETHLYCVPFLTLPSHLCCYSVEPANNVLPACRIRVDKKVTSVSFGIAYQIITISGSCCTLTLKQGALVEVQQLGLMIHQTYLRFRLYIYSQVSITAHPFDEPLSPLFSAVVRKRQFDSNPLHFTIKEANWLLDLYFYGKIEYTRKLLQLKPINMLVGFVVPSSDLEIKAPSSFQRNASEAVYRYGV